MRRVLLVFGGPSAERDVSRMSARAVGAALREAGYEVIEAEVASDGRWPDTARSAIDPFGGAPAVDAVFPLIHGPFGEDGALQGLLEWCRVPYVGSAVEGSAVAMDKAVMKTVFEAAGLPGVAWTLVRRADLVDGREVIDRCEALSDYPLFVKPARLGSSVGVERVEAAADLLAALGRCARYDDRVLVEEGFSGREVECSVLGGPPARASLPGEIVHGRAFYDYEAKYGGLATTRMIVPAELPAPTVAQIQTLALEAFVACDARDLARVDFFVGSDGRIVVNEINTLPGFTDYSMYPVLWQASGVTFPELVRELVERAVARGPRTIVLRAPGG